MAITEHSGIAHANTIRELQPYFDRLLLMTGRELTSFFGHANFFGSMAPVDFRVGRGQNDWNALLAKLPVHRLVSINHPVRPSGELCMGCGWDTDTDMRRVQAVEAVNGADADTRYSGIPFWQAQLKRGMHLRRRSAAATTTTPTKPTRMRAVRSAARPRSCMRPSCRKRRSWMQSAPATCSWT